MARAHAQVARAPQVQGPQQGNDPTQSAAPLSEEGLTPDVAGANQDAAGNAFVQDMVGDQAPETEAGAAPSGPGGDGWWDVDDPAGDAATEIARGLQGADGGDGPPVQEIQENVDAWASGQDISGTLEEGGLGATAATLQANESGLGEGEAMDSGTLGRMEGAFGADFSQVRIHTDGAGQSMASREGALAVTLGSDVAFAPGRYRPGTPEGDALLAHELAHVLQQGNQARQQAMAKSAGGTGAGGLEGDADSAAYGVMSKLYGGEQDADVEPKQSAGLKVQACGGEPPLTENVKAFVDALDAGNKTQAQEAWDALSGDERSSLRSHSTFNDRMLQALQVMGTDGLAIMKDVGANFGVDRRFGAHILDQGNPGTWVQPMKDNGLFDSFLSAEPRRQNLSDEQAGKLKPILDGASGMAEGRPIFEKAYPALQDTTYDSAKLQTVAWQIDWTQRLYELLSQYLPVAHVQTIRDGFYMGSQVMKNGSWQTLTYAWYNSGGRCVLPENSASSATEGGDTHNMTGGAGSSTHMSHFATSVLHEIGHGVGDRSDGNDWAYSNDYVDWTEESDGDWGTALFDTAAAQTAIDALPATADVVTPAQARDYMIGAIKSGSGTVPSGWLEADLKTFLTTNLMTEKLTRYWDHVRNQSKSEYRFSGDMCVSGSRVYVMLTRWDDKLCSYKKAAYDNKVSWYSLSSPKEWFAEQYAHYYRTSGAGQDATVTTKLSELDDLGFDPDSEDLEGDSASESAGGDSAGADAAAEEELRLPFSW